MDRIADALERKGKELSGRRAAGGGRWSGSVDGRYTARILPKTEADCSGSFVKPLQLLDPLRGWFPFFNTIGGEWAVEGGRKHQAGINQQDKLKPPDSPLETWGTLLEGSWEPNSLRLWVFRRQKGHLCESRRSGSMVP